MIMKYIDGPNAVDVINMYYAATIDHVALTMDRLSVHTSVGCASRD